jgi:Na+/H+ antiporter NhaD/arsenite permease-like protein
MPDIPDLTAHPLAIAALALFVLAYAFVLAEEFISLRKSKPVIICGGVIWLLVAAAWQATGRSGAEEALRHSLPEFAELFLFLLVAMPYVNTMEERQIFAALRTWLLARGLGFRSTYWITPHHGRGGALDRPGAEGVYRPDMHQHRRRECGWSGQSVR